jgi:hypothetical protein
MHAASVSASFRHGITTESSTDPVGCPSAVPADVSGLSSMNRVDLRLPAPLPEAES